MELGATICTYKKPKCLLCPVATGAALMLGARKKVFRRRRKPSPGSTFARNFIASSMSTVGCFFANAKRASGARVFGTYWRKRRRRQGRRSGELIGEIQSKHIVTRHKITRLTKVWRVEPWKIRGQKRYKKGMAKLGLWSAHENNEAWVSGGEYKWITPFDLKSLSARL